jgi:predicted Fe-Mo cluster-binding NifX family protein
MKIAVVTDDGQTISAHFGRAVHYAVLTVEGEAIVARELRDKDSHRDFQQEGLDGRHEHHDDARGHGFGRHSAEKHQRMFAAITDCEIVLARGMGQGAYNGLQQMGVRPILTDIREVDAAVEAVLDGSIEDHPERLH